MGVPHHAPGAVIDERHLEVEARRSWPRLLRNRRQLDARIEKNVHGGLVGVAMIAFEPGRGPAVITHEPTRRRPR